MSLGNDRSCRLARLIFALLMGWTWAGGATTAAPADSPAAPRPPGPEDFKRMAEQAERGYAALAAIEARMPRQSFDPKAVVADVGKDPAALTEWVRDHTAWAPYRGALRGARGVLMERIGSTLDRALLLASLLQSAGHRSVRLARAELPAEQGETLIARLRDRAAMPPAEGESPIVSAALLDPLAREHQLDPAALRRAGEKMALRRDALAEQLVARGAEQTQFLLDSLGPRDAAAQDAERARAAAVAREAARDHWWVEREEGGAWAAHDPLLAPADARPAEAKSLVLPNQKTGDLVAALAEGDCHEVRIRVVIEQRTGDQLPVTKTVAAHHLRPAVSAGAHLTISNIPTAWPTDGTTLGGSADARGRFHAATLAQREWLPVIAVSGASGGDQLIAGQGFDDAGQISEGAVGTLAAKWGFGGAGSRVGSLLGGGRERVGGAAAPAGAQLVAQWIEYEIRSPGREPRVIRRDVFDLAKPAGAADRAGGSINVTDELRATRAAALLGQVTVIAPGGDLSPQYLAHLGATAMLANRPALLGMMRAADDATPRHDLLKQLEKVRPFPGELYHLAFTRFAISPVRDHVWLDRPNVLTTYTAFRAEGDRIVSVRGFDIIANDVAVRGSGAGDAFATRVKQGVIDTNAEAMIAAAMNGPSSGPTVENTAELLARSAAQGVQWAAYRPAAEASPAAMLEQLPAGARELIGRELTAGRVVVAPDRATKLGERPAYGWWRIDPATGTCLGIGSTGRGQTATEMMMGSAIMFMAGFIWITSLENCFGDGALSNGRMIFCSGCAAGATTLMMLGGLGEIEFIREAGLFAGAAGFPGAAGGMAWDIGCGVAGDRIFGRQ